MEKNVVTEQVAKNGQTYRLVEEINLKCGKLNSVEKRCFENGENKWIRVSKKTNNLMEACAMMDTFLI